MHIRFFMLILLCAMGLFATEIKDSSSWKIELENRLSFAAIFFASPVFAQFGIPAQVALFSHGVAHGLEYELAGAAGFWEVDNAQGFFERGSFFVRARDSERPLL